MKKSDIYYLGKKDVDYDQGVIDQIETAINLPVATRAAIMPDAHLGYAMPIGGIIGLDNSISPSFVGYDIACRMRLTILDISIEMAEKNKHVWADIMRSVSSFGIGSQGLNLEHPVMDDPRWKDEPMKTLKAKAQAQLGSSGGGNHFFNLMTGHAIRPTKHIPSKAFAAIMTHSGSRGTGFQVAKHFLDLAKKEMFNRGIKVPKGYEFMDMDTFAGQDYWEAMQLMGLYAAAHHELIHEQFLAASGTEALIVHENHHNFAWRDENDEIIHRKGATPAGVNEIGIIPGTSGTNSYIVLGLGHEPSMQSSSHGAGRPHSRTEAKRLHNPISSSKYYEQKGIIRRGVAPDETVEAYKDIEHVIEVQHGVTIQPIAKMKPRVVIMGGKSDDGD